MDEHELDADDSNDALGNFSEQVDLGEAGPSSSRAVCSLPPKVVLEDYGPANYLMGRNKKNPIIVYTSKVFPNRVYEWCFVHNFTKIPGYTTWMCIQCSVIRQKQKKTGEVETTEKIGKVPRILVVDNVIREDPDNPVNRHFCQGKNVIESAVAKARVRVIRDSVDQTDGALIEGQPKIILDSSIDFGYLNPVQKKALRDRLMISNYEDNAANVGNNETLVRPTRQVYRIVPTSENQQTRQTPVANNPPRIIRVIKRSLPPQNRDDYDADHQYFPNRQRNDLKYPRRELPESLSALHGELIVRSGNEIDVDGEEEVIDVESEQS